MAIVSIQELRDVSIYRHTKCNLCFVSGVIVHVTIKSCKGKTDKERLVCKKCFYLIKHGPNFIQILAEDNDINWV